MKGIQELLAAMRAAGCTPEQILAAIDHQAQIQAEKLKEHRAKRAAQKRNERARKAEMSPNVAATDDMSQRQHDSRSDPLSLNGSPPTPYIRNIDTPPSLNPITNKRSTALSQFETFWKAYPRKIGKGAAQKAWNTAIRKAEPERIIEGVERYPWPDDPAFIPHASTWLNGQRWEDELPGMKPRKLSQAELDEQERKRIAFLEDLHRRTRNVSEKH